jgi:arsenite methyltransferase
MTKTQAATISTPAGGEAMSKQTPDYGLDGGRAVRAMFIIGPAAAIVGFLFARSTAHVGLAYAGQIFGFFCLILASLMFASSRFGKFRARDRILARLKLHGDETILDVGCGHGLLLIAAAKVLPRGRAVGIDLWSQWQQADNSREATLRNAGLEGVAQRVSVHDGDMRKMPFADGSFDAAVAHFVIHNVPSREGRREAIREIVRTLKQGGQVAISDLNSAGLYADELRKQGMIDIEISDLSFWTFPPARTVTARKPA